MSSIFLQNIEEIRSSRGLNLERWQEIEEAKNKSIDIWVKMNFNEC
jgi:hypothetical protein